MPNDTIFAWTAPGSHYPECLNLTHDGDAIVVTVRAKPEGEFCGKTNSIRVPLDAWKEFLAGHDLWKSAP